MRWCLVSVIPHQWHSVCSCEINLRVCSISLLPSHPIRILKIYLISFIMWLFSLKYFWAFTWYSSPPSFQNSFSVGNSLLIIVLCLALLSIFLLICFLTSYFHFDRSLLQLVCMNSKSVTYISLIIYLQYLIVLVCNSEAFLNILLCSVFSSSTVLPIITNVFLRFRCVSFFIPNSISVASFVPYIGDLSMALMALLFDILYFSCICSTSLNGVFIRPYSTCAYIAPIIKFLLIFGVIPPPLSMNGTSCALVLSAFFSCFSWCS